MTCEPGMCWAEPLGEATDHWEAEAKRARAEVERLREALTKIAANPQLPMSGKLAQSIAESALGLGR